MQAERNCRAILLRHVCVCVGEVLGVGDGQQLDERCIYMEKE